MKIIYYLLLASIMFLTSCGKTNFADEILKMQSRPIDLTACEGAVCYENGERTTYSSADSAYRLIIYVDSTSCSPCFVSHMLDYMGAVVDLDSAGVSTLFLFEPKQEQKEDLTSSLAEMSYPLRSIVVANGSFSSANPHLPPSTMLHSFLLNEKNEVVVVGNPARNDKVKELMLNTVKSQKEN
ncbi:MAG: hypothetical protein J6B92_05730 [Paraprevotella sp.]|nr:hypothetical protein [Paraprevotella sp.]